MVLADDCGRRHLAGRPGRGLLPDPERCLPFDPAIETLPLLIALPLTLTGIVGVAWPTNMSRDDRLRSILDISLGLAALMVIWSLIVIPRWSLPSDPGQAAVSRADQWVLLIGFAVILTFLVLNRKRGGLPLPQMLLLFGGFTILFISDPGGRVRRRPLTSRDAVHLRLLDRDLYVRRDAPAPPAEAEGVRQEEQRDLLAFLAPMALIAVAGLIVIQLAAQSRPDSLLLKVAPVLWVLGIRGRHRQQHPDAQTGCADTRGHLRSTDPPRPNRAGSRFCCKTPPPSHSS